MMGTMRRALFVLPLMTATMMGVGTVSAGPPAGTSGSDAGDVPIGVDCGEFEVWDEYETHWNGKRFFDADGNFVRFVEHVWGTDRLYNPENGKSVSGTINSGEILDRVDGTVRQNGSIFRITVPGAGAVFIDVGTYIIDLDTDEVVFLAGRHDYFAGDTDALCAALA